MPKKKTKAKKAGPKRGREDMNLLALRIASTATGQDLRKPPDSVVKATKG